MCAINPKYQHTINLKINIYTAHGTEEEFISNVRQALADILNMEQKWNLGKLRFHFELNEDDIYRFIK